MNPETLKGWVELAIILLGWLGSLIFAYFRLVYKVNGVGGKVNSLEITVGQHETAIDAIQTEQQVAAQDRKQLFKDVGEFRSEVSNLNKTCRESDEKNSLLLTNIQVEIGKLGTKVDILLQERK